MAGEPAGQAQRPLAVGFLGAGNLNRLHHMANVARMSAARIHAICDLDPQRLASAAERYKPQLATRDYQEMLADREVELVIIATRPHLQANLARQALEAHKHVFVEKPMAESMEGCLELERIARQVGRTLATGYNRRFSPAYRDIKGMLADCHVPPLMSYRLMDDTRDRPNWADRPHLLDEVCHIFDILAFFADDEPVETYCVEVPVQNYQIIIRFSRGATAHIITGGRGHFAWPKERIEIVMDHAVVAVDDFVELHAANVPGFERKCYRGREYEGRPGGYADRMAREGLIVDVEIRKQIAELWQTDGLVDMPPGPQRDAKWQEVFGGKALPPINYTVDKGWYAAMEHLIESLASGTKPQNADGIDAARSIACAEAAAESARTGEPVPLRPSQWALAD